MNGVVAMPEPLSRLAPGTLPVYNRLKGLDLYRRLPSQLSA